MNEEQIKAMQAENEQLKATFEQASSEREKMQAKMDELLTETKNAKAKRKEAEAQAQADIDKVAKEKGDFESLYNSANSKLEKITNEYSVLQGNIAKEKVANASIKIAGQLAEGANAELLSNFVSGRLKHTDEGLKVVDGSGNLTVSSLDDLANEFKSDPKYSALLKGNQSSGGGASGGSSSGGATNNSKLTSTQRIAEGLKNQT